MFRITRSKVLPIALDIGADAVRMLQVEVAGETPIARCIARQALPASVKAQPASRSAAAAECIRQMVRKHPFNGRRIVTAVPREMVHVKNFRMPQMPLGELEAAIQFEAQNLFSFDVIDAQVHFIPAGDVRQGSDVLQEVIVLAARNEEIDAHVELLHRAGVIVDSLDFEACALYRGVERFTRRREDEQDVHVLVDVGATGTRIVVGRGREISFVKTIEIGGWHFSQAVARRLEIPVEEAFALRHRLNDAVEQPADNNDPVRQAVADATRGVMEQLSRELSLCLRYFSVTFRGQRPGKVRLYGGDANDANLCAVLTSALSIPIEVARPLGNLDLSHLKPGDRRGGAEWGVALGLALRRCEQRFGARDGRSRLARRVEVMPVDHSFEAGAAHSSGSAESSRQEAHHA